MAIEYAHLLLAPLSVERMITHSLVNTSCTLISVPSSEDSEKQSHSNRLLTKHLLQASSCALGSPYCM